MRSRDSTRSAHRFGLSERVRALSRHIHRPESHRHEMRWRCRRREFRVVAAYVGRAEVGAEHSFGMRETTVPGGKLTVRSVAQELGLNTTPIRDAIVRSARAAWSIWD
ncbi:hypothetical protein XH93_10205 [Bradyrhizobium sp. CCBAU 51753]|nr:hypothetical protein XH93_10205 [Bradyrhizobium sp. CCBAU 51753]